MQQTRRCEKTEDVKNPKMQGTRRCKEPKDAKNPKMCKTRRCAKPEDAKNQKICINIPNATFDRHVQSALQEKKREGLKQPLLKTNAKNTVFTSSMRGWAHLAIEHSSSQQSSFEVLHCESSHSHVQIPGRPPFAIGTCKMNKLSLLKFRI